MLIKLLLAMGLGASLAAMPAQGSNIVSPPVAKIATAYAITAAQERPQRDPKDWQLLGSNDGGQTWTILDVRKDERFATRSQRRQFEIIAPAAFSLYRLQIDAVQEPEKSPWTHLAEWELLNREGNSVESEPGTDKIVSAQGEQSAEQSPAQAFDSNLHSAWLDRLHGQLPNIPSSWIQVEFCQITPLTNLSQFLNLPARRAIKGYPIRWEGVVIYADPRRDEVLFKDATGTTKVQVDLRSHPVAAGQRVVLEGTTSAVVFRYPDRPTGRHYLTSFEAPSNIDNRYLARVRGFLHPPQTGEYTFWIAADDEFDLGLSTDETPAHVRKIASIPTRGYTGSRQWDSFASQRSEKIFLTAGKRYYIEGLHKETTGEDCLAVAWAGPGISRAVIAGDFLSPWDPDKDDAQLPSSPRGTLLREYWLKHMYFRLSTLQSSPPTEYGETFIAQPRLTTLAEESLPAPLSLIPEQPIGPAEEWAWVEIEGVIRQVVDDGDYWTILDLAEGNRRMKLQVPNPAREKTESWLNARVRVRGFCQATFNERAEAVAGRLWVPHLRELVVRQPQPQDWPLLPTVSIRDLTEKNTSIRPGQRVRIQGRQVKQNLGETVVLRDNVSRFTSFISPDGGNWDRGPTVDIPMNASIYAGFAVASHVPNLLGTAVADHVQGLSGPWSKLDIGEPPLAGRAVFDGQKFTLQGAGGSANTPSGSGVTSDQFHYFFEKMEGAREIVARLASLERTDGYATAGLMMRETLESNSKYVFLGLYASWGTYFSVRKGTGFMNESIPSGRSAPYWLKLVRERDAQLVMHSNQTTALSADQLVEAMGVLEQTSQGWALVQAFYQPAAELSVSSREKQPQLTSIEQIRQLDAEQLVQNPPVRLRGVVTAKAGDLYMQDGTGGIRIPALVQEKYAFCDIGQYIEVQGACAAGDYSPVLTLDHFSRVTVLGAGQMPKAQPKSWDQLATGTADAQWVEIKGVIRSIEGRRLKCQMPGGIIFAESNFEFSIDQARRLIDAKVQLRGVCKVITNERKQLIGTVLLIPAAEHIVVERVPEDPFAQRTHLVHDLLKFEASDELNHRVKVSGVVTGRHNQKFFLQDATGGLTIENRGNETLHRGDRIEVVGFAESGGFAPVLTDVLVRKQGVGELPASAKIPMSELLSGKYEAQRVTIDAILLGQKMQGAEQILELLSENWSFRAVLRAGADRLMTIPAGSQVRLQGIFEVDASSLVKTREVASFRIHLDSPADLVVLKYAPWWTLKHTLGVAAVMVLLLGSALGWVRTLRHNVNERTQALREKTEQLEKEIEEHKRTEAQLADKTTHLEQEIEERTRMEQQVAKTNQQLLLASRQAGMAEVATGVLHNVGNALTSVNVSATLIGNKINQLKIVPLAKLSDLLEENRSSPAFLSTDDKGKQIPAYLKQLSAHMAAAQEESLKELQSLRQNIEHINEIVAMQQNYSRLGGVTETVKVSVMVDDAIRINVDSFNRHHLELKRDYRDDAMIEIEKHKVLQILVNLIGNAKQACEKTNNLDKRVTLRVVRNGPNRIQIQVIDNGVGIPAANMTRIFSYGFTTRKDGHGFGLHSSANAATEIGGQLSVHSDGEGQGATFTLDLPLTRPSRQNDKLSLG